MKLLLTPLDTWFFRGSTPFDMDTSPQAGVCGIFPPHPPTVAGAIRAALARGQGWNGEGSWSETLKAVLGDGPDNLGKLEITGPFVVCNGEPIFPMPRHVVSQQSSNGCWSPVFLRPGKDYISCDLGSLKQLPETNGPGPKQSLPQLKSGLWITFTGLCKVLQGELPTEADVVDEDELWSEELHVGIRRGPGTHATEEGALYSARHTRLRKGVGLAVEVAGLPDEWKIAPGSLLPLGGESRLAACEPWNFELNLELEQTEHASAVCMTLIALTPALLERSALCGDTDLVPGSGMRVTSACVDRPLRIGGWDSLARKPLPLRNALSPDTALFCRGDCSRLQAARGMTRLGKGTSAGFGLFAIGQTPV
jgi:CRISPR-associated protein Cmr3